MTAYASGVRRRACLQLVISPMVQLELSHRHEIGRLTIGGADTIDDLERRVGLQRSALALETLVDTAASSTWARDPFDRLVVIDALVAGAALMARDRTIHEHSTIARQ